MLITPWVIVLASAPATSPWPALVAATMKYREFLVLMQDPRLYPGEDPRPDLDARGPVDEEAGVAVVVAEAGTASAEEEGLLVGADHVEEGAAGVGWSEQLVAGPGEEEGGDVEVGETLLVVGAVVSDPSSSEIPLHPLDH